MFVFLYFSIFKLERFADATHVLFEVDQGHFEVADLHFEVELIFFDHNEVFFFVVDEILVDGLWLPDATLQ